MMFPSSKFLYVSDCIPRDNSLLAMVAGRKIILRTVGIMREFIIEKFGGHSFFV